MKRDPLAILARLERQTLDARRGAMVEAQGRQDRLRGRAARHKAAWSEAVEQAVTAEAELDLWGALSRGTRHVLDRALAERDAQATELAEARAALQASLVELKRLDVLTERRRQRDHAARALRERIELDDLAILRHRREKGG
ncbi:MAG: hypothetical protein R3D28_11500 [Geminicoccaceae bacterium]